MRNRCDQGSSRWKGQRYGGSVTPSGFGRESRGTASYRPGDGRALFVTRTYGISTGTCRLCSFNILGAAPTAAAPSAQVVAEDILQEEEEEDEDAWRGRGREERTQKAKTKRDKLSQQTGQRAHHRSGFWLFGLVFERGTSRVARSSSYIYRE